MRNISGIYNCFQFLNVFFSKWDFIFWISIKCERAFVDEAPGTLHFASIDFTTKVDTKQRVVLNVEIIFTRFTCNHISKLCLLFHFRSFAERKLRQFYNKTMIYVYMRRLRSLAGFNLKRWVLPATLLNSNSSSEKTMGFNILHDTHNTKYEWCELPATSRCRRTKSEKVEPRTTKAKRLTVVVKPHRDIVFKSIFLRGRAQPQATVSFSPR